MKSRRKLLWALSAFLTPHFEVSAQHLATSDLLKQFIGNSPVQEGRVVLQIPRLTDNGLSVPLKVSVESAMHVNDHVLQLLLLSNRNPRPLIAAFEFGPESSKPNFLTRVRLGGSQTVFALAQMSDGSWWLDSAEVEVTESACLDQT